MSGGGKLRVGVLGATGYTGQELLRRLARHPKVSVGFATSRSESGTPTPIPGLSLTPPDEGAAREAELVFLCLPHGEAAAWAERLAGGPKIIDLTADHRPGSGREEGWIYGMAEQLGDEVRGARRIANPGCYPTGVILSLAPLLAAGVVDRERLTVVNAASGVTGAGRTPRADLLFAELYGNFRAYGEGNVHRHRKEMVGTLGDFPLLFQPHLLPVSRGILETIILPVTEGADAAHVRELWKGAYGVEQGAGGAEEGGWDTGGEGGAGTPSSRSVISVMDKGIPDLAMVTGTDRLVFGVVENAHIAPPVLTVAAAFDNLGKGAAGQAVQNMNLVMGWEREMGVWL